MLFTTNLCKWNIHVFWAFFLSWLCRALLLHLMVTLTTVFDEEEQLYQRPLVFVAGGRTHFCRCVFGSHSKLDSTTWLVVSQTTPTRADLKATYPPATSRGAYLPFFLELFVSRRHNRALFCASVGCGDSGSQDNCSRCLAYTHLFTAIQEFDHM